MASESNMNMKAISEEDLKLLNGIITADKDQLVKLYDDFLPGILLYVKKTMELKMRPKMYFRMPS